MQKNELYTVKIEDTNDLGYGVCRIEGLVTFVALAVTGDEARVRIIKVARDYAVARMEELLSPSPHRREVACPSFHRCGGCAFLHLTDDFEKSLKEGFVRTSLKQNGLEIPVRPLLCTKTRIAYRNKAQYPLFIDREGRFRAGFYARKSHAPVTAEGCLLQPPIFGEIARAFCDEFDRARLTCYDETTGRGLLRHLNLRSDSRGSVCAEIVVNASSVGALSAIASTVFDRFDALIGVLVNYNTKNTNVIRGPVSSTLVGETTLCQELCDKRFFHGPASFFQVNPSAAELLFREAGRLLDASPNESICDLYCGVGAVGQCIAPNSRIHGADVVKEAISFAERNAAENGCDASYVAMDAAEYFAAAGTFDAVLVDPPRGGLSPEMLALLLTKRPKKILYISCNPKTLCRDLKALLQDGYKTDGITPVDLFPKTGHVECTCLLTLL